MWYMIPPWWCVPIILLKDNKQDNFTNSEWKVLISEDGDLAPVWVSKYPTVSVISTAWFTALLTAVWDDLGFLDWWSTWFTAGQTNNIIKNIVPDNTTSPYFRNGWKYILMIANTTSSTWYYCLLSDTLTPTQYVTIDVQWTYRNTTLDLKWVRKAWLPADFCYTAISG